MIEKKSAKGNIDNKRGSYLLIGLVIILSLVYAGFELFATQDQAKDMSIQDEEAVEVFDEQTKNVEQPETAPPPQEQIREQVIEVVDNDVLVESKFEFNAEFDENEAVSDYTVVEVIQEETEKEPPLRFVEDMPQFPGGAEAWVAYLQKELKYPESCRILNLSGVVVVEFIVEKDGKIYVSLDESLLFASGSWTVNAKGKDALMKLSNVLAENPDIAIMVEGHTDNLAYKGSGQVKDNWDLSVMRATSVTKIILDNKSVDPKRITSAGRGEYFPIDGANNSEARQKNRRTEIILTPNMDEFMKILNNQ